MATGQTLNANLLTSVNEWGLTAFCSCLSSTFGVTFFSMSTIGFMGLSALRLLDRESMRDRLSCQSAEYAVTLRGGRNSRYEAMK